jgi:hypothetical protein
MGERSGESSRGRTGRVAGAGDEGIGGDEAKGAVTVEAGFNALPITPSSKFGSQGETPI